MTKDEALKMVVEAKKRHGDGWWVCDEAIQACKEALEQPAQEPWGWYENHDIYDEKQSDESIALYTHPAPQSAQEPVALVYSMQDGYVGQMVVKDIPHNTKLYTHPCVLTHSAPSWQGLSDEEISKVISDEQIPVRTGKTANRFARVIEQALKEKNYGQTR